MRMAEYKNGVLVYRDMTPEEISNTQAEDNFERIYELKQRLAETDYIACKIAEGSATIEEYSQQIEQRRKWREEINSLS